MQNNSHHSPSPSEELKSLAKAMTDVFMGAVNKQFETTTEVLNTIATVFLEARAMIRSEVPPSRTITAEDLADLLEWLATAFSKEDTPHAE